jgi:hypothetical protein
LYFGLNDVLSYQFPDLVVAMEEQIITFTIRIGYDTTTLTTTAG